MGTLNKKSDVLAEVRSTFGIVPQWFQQMPEQAIGGFWSLMRDFYLAETKIPNKYKELIGIAVSGATRCKYCTFFHTEAARMFGATDAEIHEAAAMGGLTMMASTFINAEQIDYEAFKKETQEIVKYVREKQGNGNCLRLQQPRA